MLRLTATVSALLASGLAAAQSGASDAPQTPSSSPVSASVHSPEASPDSPIPHGIVGPVMNAKAPAKTVVPNKPEVPVAKPVPQAYVQWLTSIAQFEAADKVNPPPQGGVLFIGSSTLRLWKSLKADFPQLEKVINRGFGGSTMADNAYFVDRLVYPYRPRSVLVYAGDNDLVMGREPTRVLSDFTALFEAIRRELPDTRITYISIKPSPSRAQFSAKITLTNLLIQRYLETQANTDYVDIYHPMLDANGKPRPELFLKDQLHMNRDGYEIWKTVIAQHLPQRSPNTANGVTQVSEAAAIAAPQGHPTSASPLSPAAQTSPATPATATP